jgi:hypothetical protein
MAEKIKKKKSLRQRLTEKVESLKRGGPNPMITFKEGKTRIRILPVGEENDWGIEVTYFFLGLKEQYSLISAATFGEKCAFQEAYDRLSTSKKESEREFAKKRLKPGRRFIVPAIKYTDEKGLEIDKEMGIKPALFPSGIYEQAVELFLDDDNGDFTDPLKGYDLKVKRTGKGKNDTEYSLIKCNSSKLPKELRGEIDLEKMIRDLIIPYKKSKELLEKYLNIPVEEDEEEEKPKKKKKKSRDL